MENCFLFSRVLKAATVCVKYDTKSTGMFVKLPVTGQYVPGLGFVFQIMAILHVIRPRLSGFERNFFRLQRNSNYFRIGTLRADRNII